MTRQNIKIWDSNLWMSEFRQAKAIQNPSDRTYRLHRLRKKVYEYTLEAVKSQSYVTENGVSISLNLNPDIARETVFCEREIIPMNVSHRYETELGVCQMDCLDAARDLVERYGEDQVCVLNMASWKNPGGGVLNGAGAQEEYLFRCSDYFRSLYPYKDYASMYGAWGIVRNTNHSYPLNEQFGGVFSRGVTVFRSNESKGYAFLEKPWKVNFVAVAAHKDPATFRRNDGEMRLTDPEVSFMENKVRTILRIAVRNGQTALVLGALGCGAFHNPPLHVAEIFKSVLHEPEFEGVFRCVQFAIVEDHNSHGNFAQFSKVFSTVK